MYAQPKRTDQILQGISILKPIYTICTDEEVSISKEVLNLASTVTFVTASYYFQLEMKALTIAFQILCEVYEALSIAYTKEDKDWISYLEILSNVALAGIRVKLGKNDIQDAYYRHFGKELTQDTLNAKIIEWDRVFETNGEEKTTWEKKFDELYNTEKLSNFWSSIESIEKFFHISNGVLVRSSRIPNIVSYSHEGKFIDWLRSSGYSNHLKNLTLSKMNNIYFKNIIFTSCAMKGSITNCTFKGTAFLDCDFESTKILTTCFSQTFFRNCEFKKINAKNCNFFQVLFADSSFEKGSIIDSNFQNVIFAFSNIYQTVFYGSTFDRLLLYKSELNEANFLYVNAQNCMGKMSTVTNSVLGKLKKATTFQNCKFLKDKPVIIYPTYHNANWSHGPKICLEACGGVIMTFQHKGLDTESKVGNEAKWLLAQHRDKTAKTPSVKILFDHARSGSIIHKIKLKVQEAMEEADGVVIHGGPNVSPQLYNQPGADVTERDLTEGFAVEIAGRRNKAVGGICRGTQLVSIVRGGSVRNVSFSQGSQVGDIEIPISEREKERLPFLRGVQSLSTSNAHYQQVEKMGKNLTPVIVHNDVPKAIVGPKTMLVQFHPEHRWNDSNEVQRNANRGFYHTMVLNASEDLGKKGKNKC